MIKTAKINVGIICGGQSPEHDISLLSSKNILAAIDTEKFIPHLIYIQKNGIWVYDDQELCLLPGHKHNFLVFKHNPEKTLPLDIVFPILHGPMGEDGTIQGLFEFCGIPYVGSGVLGSAINMDKDITKRLLTQAGINTADFLVFKKQDSHTINYNNIISVLKTPLFIKPTNTGSSIGVNKVNNKQDFDKAILEAFKYDSKIICESFIAGREIECAILGNNNPEVSIPGEIIAHEEFYTYQAKYFNEQGATVEVPAKISADASALFQQTALHAYKTLECRGFARVDGFLTPDGQVFINEINTLPGFTNISMYPKCWQASGVNYTDLISRLIVAGLENR